MRRWWPAILVVCVLMPLPSLAKRSDIPGSQNGFNGTSDCPVISESTNGPTPFVAALNGNAISKSPCLDVDGNPILITYPDKRLTISGSGFMVTINPFLWMGGGNSEKTILEIKLIAPSTFTLESIGLQGNLDFVSSGNGYITCEQNTPDIDSAHLDSAFKTCVKAPIITIPRAAPIPPDGGGSDMYSASSMVANEPDVIAFAGSNRNITVIDFANFHGGDTLYIALKGVMSDNDVMAATQIIATALQRSPLAINSLVLTGASVAATVTDGNGQRSVVGGLALTYPACSGTPCAAPANDSVDNATAISPSSLTNGTYVDTSEITGATKDARDPQLTIPSAIGNASCYDGPTTAFDPGDIASSTRTVWYTFSSQAAGSVTISTEGSRFDTRLAVFDGKPGSTSTALACSDDTSVNGTIEPQSKLTSATAGTPANPHQYYIMVSEAPKPKGTTLDGLGNILYVGGDNTQPQILTAIPQATHAVLVFSLTASTLQGDKSGLSFNSQRVGTASGALSVIVSSPSGSISSIVPTPSGDFSVSNNGCLGLTISGVTACTIQVKFTPTASGVRAGTLSIASSAVLGPLTVSLSGSGYIPQANLSATSVVFADQQLNATSSAQRITLTNNGDGPLSIASFTASSAIAPFAIATATCGSSLPATQNCFFDFNFTPTTAGPANASFIITDDAAGPGSQQSISLSGNGVGGVTLGPQPSSYADTFVNALSAPQKITLKNSSTGTISISNVSVTGPFSVLSTTCSSPPFSLAVGLSCDYFVVLAPKSAGPASGTFAINDSAGTQSVTLAGSGIQILISPSRPDRTAKPSGTASAGISPSNVAVPEAASNVQSVISVSVTAAPNATPTTATIAPPAFSKLKPAMVEVETQPMSIVQKPSGAKTVRPLVIQWEPLGAVDLATTQDGLECGESSSGTCCRATKRRVDFIQATEEESSKDDCSARLR